MDRVFSKRNRDRCQSLSGFNHPLQSWTASDWMVALAGEVGEAANIIKKLNRFRDGIPGNTETVQVLTSKLGEELADVYTYLDLLCQSQGIDLRKEVESKFEKVSKKMGYVDGFSV